ncbi:hypothetical protein EF847_10295 [Actinobacteria bacterium YIM 96077]|uniref:Uncharacterized protein n=1 Tax=Phytoactinopolyspora halophila TaxID=1981511 RepID=A0A329QHA0_9ACTN|nr:hypothetical protein EF847_10295 [Actinobacteria bacterium YIM 96077]RAW09708.1 hypothetical protein DPM12_20330 [Phytoactinopolyspora halophila]
MHAVGLVLADHAFVGHPYQQLTDPLILVTRREMFQDAQGIAVIRGDRVTAMDADRNACRFAGAETRRTLDRARPD